MAEKSRSTSGKYRVWGLFAWPFGRLNLIILSIGVVFIAVGYVFLSQGPATNPLSLTVAPIVLLLGYLVFLPASILVRDPRVSGRKGEGSGKGD